MGIGRIVSGLARRERDRAGERGDLLSRSPLMSHSGMDVGGFGTKPRLEHWSRLLVREESQKNNGKLLCISKVP